MLKSCLAFVLFFLAVSSLAPAQTRDYPEVTRFATRIEGTLWDLRGTNNLKHLRYKGLNLHEVRPDGRQGSAYDHAFVDVGVIRINFRGSHTGWYFFSDDLKWLTSLTVEGEVELKRAEGSPAKPVARFPEDIQGVVWDAVPDDRQLKPMRLRWNGKELEIGAKTGEAWLVDRNVPVIAETRVFEVIAPDGSPLWFAFSADGTEAWMLQIKGIFGGHARNDKSKSAVTVEESGLTPQLNDLANHTVDLLAEGEKMRGATLRRQLLRQLKAKPEQAKAVEARLSGPP